MNSRGRRNSENSTVYTCLGWSKRCFIHTIVLAISTSIFVTCMILSVYLTYKASLDKIVVVLIVGACLLYLLGFFGNMYSIYRNNPNNILSENGEIVDLVCQTNSVSTQSSTNAQIPDIAFIPQTRELFRKTPPPPYEIQMSEMSRMLLPSTSGTTESSRRELEIAEEARKLIKRMYEEIRMAEQRMSPSLIRDQPLQQMVDRPMTPIRQHQVLLSPKAVHQNLVVQRQQTHVKNIGSRLPTVDSRSSPVIQQKVGPNFPPNQLEERLIIENKACYDSSQQSPQRQDLQYARKRKLISPSKDVRLRSQSERNVTPVGDEHDSQNNTYEEIEFVGSNQNKLPPHAACGSVDFCNIESEFENASAASAAFERRPTILNKKCRNPNIKIRRQLSAPSTRKFRHLGQTPETVLDAIATCFDLTPDEWMVAWKLGHNGVSPKERARILGVQLHEDPQQ